MWVKLLRLCVCVRDIKSPIYKNKKQQTMLQLEFLSMCVLKIGIHVFYFSAANFLCHLLARDWG